MNQFIHQNSFRGKQHYFQFFTLKSNKTIGNKGSNGSLLNFKYAFEKIEIRGCQWKKHLEKYRVKKIFEKKNTKIMQSRQIVANCKKNKEILKNLFKFSLFYIQVLSAASIIRGYYYILLALISILLHLYLYLFKCVCAFVNMYWCFLKTTISLY